MKKKERKNKKKIEDSKKVSWNEEP